MAKLYKTFYDVSRFTLWADSPSEDGKRAQFILSFRDGNPRFVVKTGVPGKEGMINFPMDNTHIATAMIMLEDLAKGPNDKQVSVDSSAPVWENDKPTKEKKVVSVLHMGKSKEGIVYFCVTSEGKPKVVFPFKPSPFHVFKDANKELIPVANISRDMALGVARIMLDVISKIIVDYTKDEYESGDRTATPITGGSKPGGAKAAQVQFADLDDIL